MMPYQRKVDILSQKAAGNAQLMNAGLQNAFGGMQTGVMAKSGLFGSAGDSSVGQDYSSLEYGSPRASRYQVQRAAYQ
jgi:hypothetical protein